MLYAWLEQLGWSSPPRDECEDTSAALITAAIAQLELAFGRLDDAQKEQVEDILSCDPPPTASASASASAYDSDPWTSSIPEVVVASAGDAEGIHACVLAIEQEFSAWANFCAVVAAAPLVPSRPKPPRCPSYDEARGMGAGELVSFVNHLPQPLPATITRGCTTAATGGVSGASGVGGSVMAMLVRANSGAGAGMEGEPAFDEVFARKGLAGGTFSGGQSGNNDGGFGGGGSTSGNDAAAATPAPTPEPLPEYRGEWRWLDQGSGEQTWSCSTSWEAATDTSTSESFTHGLEQSVTASGGVKFFGVGVDIEASAGASQEWSSAVERTISQVRGGEEAAQCGSPVCTGGNLHRWAVRRYIGGAPAEELETCSFVCIRNSLNRLAKPKCPVGWCGQDPDPDSASGTGDCQCCNGIEWAADTTDEDARELTCPGATDPNGDPYPWMATAASVGASLPATVGTHDAIGSILLNGATCYNCN